ncbi:hypothetical protein ACIVBQ_000557 [Tenacibaculum discolor]
MGFFQTLLIMKKIKHSVINGRIENGTNSVQVQGFIKPGKVVKLALFSDSSPSKPVNVKLEDTGGDELHPLVSHKEYEPTNGNHFESRKEIYFEGNRDVVVKAVSSENHTSDFNFQLIFYIEQ